MSAYAEIADLTDKLTSKVSFKHVVWVAAGGSFGGFYPAHYFLEHEATSLSTHMFTSNEFIYSTPRYVGKDTLVVVCSMRGTKETIEAARTAKQAGATVVALYVQTSKLLDYADYSFAYESIAIDESRTDRVNSSVALMLAEALLNTYEGYLNHDLFVSVWDKIDGIYRRAFESQQTIAKTWANSVCDSTCIRVIGSGPASASAYIFSICNLEEMLQIHSPHTNSCEWFHGPFEVTDLHDPIFLLVSEGTTRDLDLRALSFLERYAKDDLFVLDAKDLGLDDIDPKVRDYFNHILFSPVLNNVYMRALAATKGKDYLSRSYMWQVSY